MTFELGKREARNKVSLIIVVPKDNVNTVEAPIHHGSARRTTRNAISAAV